MKPALADTEFAQRLFTRFSRLRERNAAPKSPWGQDWETFLEDAGLRTAEDEIEARRTAFLLATDRLLDLKLRRDGERIHRFTVPLISEREWFAAFGRIHPADVPAERIDLKAIPWVTQLQFLVQSRLNVVTEDLLKLNVFLSEGSCSSQVIPIKERSLQIFGDEKRLDTLLTSTLFRPDRLDLRAHLRCETVGTPLGWKRGPHGASARPVIAIENAATWHSFCRWNEKRGLFSAVIYGDGNRFVDAMRYLPDIFTELGGPRRTLYFGDLDPQGVLIPQEASGRAQSAGLPPVEAHLWSYRQLLRIGAAHPQRWEGDKPSLSLCDWLGDLATPALDLFSSGKRLPQEHINWEFLQHIEVEDC